MSIMSAPRASTSSRAASGSMRTLRVRRLSVTQRDGVGLVDAGELDDAAPVAEGFADAVEALLVLVVHAAEVGGDAEVVGDEEEEGLRVGASGSRRRWRRTLPSWSRGCRGS